MKKKNSIGKYAAIDIGSNTLRLLVAGINDSQNQFRTLRIERIITRLGENFEVDRTLKKAPVGRTIKALKKFSEITQSEKVSRLAVAATAVIREAKNRDWFVSEVKRQTGLRVRVLSGVEEAILSLKGVFNAIDTVTSPAVVVDIGGGSTEIIAAIWGKPPELLYVKSLPLGVVKLTEGFLKKDPPGKRSCENLRKSIRTRFCYVAREIKSSMKSSTLLHPRRPTMIATAGTPTTAAAIYLRMDRYDPDRITGTVLKIEWLEELADRLANTPVKERENITGLEKGREDIILSGILILVELMALLGFSQVTVCDSGLLEGLIWDLIDNNPLVKW